MAIQGNDLFTGFGCPRCGHREGPERPATHCRCGAPLLAEYDMEAARLRLRPQDWERGGPACLRFSALLPPGAADDRALSLGEGDTPLLPAPRLAEAAGMRAELYIKDEGRNPTGSFKDRGAAAAVRYLRGHGVTRVGLPTAGNAGAAWAAHCARAGIDLHVAAPADAPPAVLESCRGFGARVTTVPGVLPDAGRFMVRTAPSEGRYLASTLREPCRVEGKKTIALELAASLGWRAPQAVIFPTGGGVGVIGIYRGFRQLQQLGWLRGDLPRMVVVQPEGCAPLVRAVAAGWNHCEPWPEPRTRAGGIRVPGSVGDFLVLEAVYVTGGTAVAVSDEEMAVAARLLAGNEGISAALEGGAAVAGTLRLAREGWFRPEAAGPVIIVNTSRGGMIGQA